MALSVVLPAGALPADAFSIFKGQKLNYMVGMYFDISA